MGLAHQVGNTVTLSYRQAAFGRIKERNARRLEESVRKEQLKVVLNSNPVEFTPDAVRLDVQGSIQKLPNDYVWIFAGGEPPTAFLKKIGIAFGPTDLTSEGSKQVRELELVQA
jgi:thioredoxin reductase